MLPTAGHPSLPTPDSSASQPLSPSSHERYFIGTPTQAVYHVPSAAPHSFPITEYQPPTALHYPTSPHTAYPSFAAMADSRNHSQDGILTPPDASGTFAGFHSSPLPVTGYTGHTFIHPPHPHTSPAVYQSPHNPASHPPSLPNHHPTVVGPPTPGGYFHSGPSQPFHYNPARTHSLSPKLTDRSISIASAKSAPPELLEMAGENGGRERGELQAPSRGLGIGYMETRRTRSAQACDHCRRRKAKCIGNPCQRCTRGNRVCTFSPIEHHRGISRSKVAPTPSAIASASAPQLGRHGLNSQSRRVSSGNLAAHMPTADISRSDPGRALGLQFHPQYPHTGGSVPLFQTYPVEILSTAQVQAFTAQGHPLTLINGDPAVDHQSVYFAPVHVGDFVPGRSNMWGLEQGAMGMHIGAVAGDGGWVVQGVASAEYPQWAGEWKVGEGYLVSRPRTPVSPTGLVDEIPGGWPS